MSLGPPQPGSSGQINGLKAVVKASQDTYRRDLRALFEHARDRFGDVKWEDLDHELDNSEREEAGGFEAVDFAFENGKPTDLGKRSAQVAQEAVWAHKGEDMKCVSGEDNLLIKSFDHSRYIFSCIQSVYN
jgi:hypothetical protein